MKLPRITSVTVERYPIVRIVFDDGVAGEIDHAPNIARGKIFAPLGTPDFFKNVAVGELGHCYGWKLDDVGHEIDFGADSARTQVETSLVSQMAGRYRNRMLATQ